MNEDKKKLTETIERLQARETLQQPLNIEQLKNWLVFGVLLILILLLILWSFFGRIPTEVQGRAVALSTSGTFLIRSKIVGSLQEIYVKVGDQVQEGDPLIKIYSPEIKAKLVQIVSEKFKNEQLRTELSLVKHTYEINQNLYKKGLIAKIVLQDSKTKVLDKEIEIESSDASLAQFFNDLVKVSAANPSQVRLIYNTLVDNNQTQQNLGFFENFLSIVRAPSSGRILEILGHLHEPLNRKDPLVWMEYPHQGKSSEVFYSAVNADITGRIRPGMRVLIEPFSVNPQQYGAIEGRVREVYPFPVSKTELMRWMENQQIVDYLLSSNTVVTYVIVEPILNHSTISGFKWTSKNGPPYQIPTGSVAKLKLVIDEQPPISYLIPLWKLKEPLNMNGTSEHSPSMQGEENNVR